MTQMHVPLPQSEIDYLASIAHDRRALRARLRALWDQGWSLSILGAALSPKRPRATVHYWIKDLSPLSSSHQPPLPFPSVPRPLVMELASTSNATIRTAAPSLTPEQVQRLRSLSAQARRYRARTAESNAFAVANRQFTDLVKALRSEGIPAVEIARAAGISYRAVARRIAR